MDIVRPFKRHDGIHELVVESTRLGEVKARFVEDTEMGREGVFESAYYIQVDSNYSCPEYKRDSVYLIKGISVSDEIATYKHLSTSGSDGEGLEWVEDKCLPYDFRNLLDKGELIPMERVE